jgi:hypothetical protein
MMPNSNADCKIVEYPNFYLTDEPNRMGPGISKLVTNLEFQPMVSLYEGLAKLLN